MKTFVITDKIKIFHALFLSFVFLVKLSEMGQKFAECFYESSNFVLKHVFVCCGFEKQTTYTNTHDIKLLTRQKRLNKT